MFAAPCPNPAQSKKKISGPAHPIPEEPTPDQIKGHRDSLGLSQVKYAELLDIARGTLRSWEAGESAPRGRKLARLIEVFAMSADEVGRALSEREAANRVRSTSYYVTGASNPRWDITIGTDDSIIAMEVKVLRWNGKQADGKEAIQDFSKFQESLQEWIREQGWRLEIESFLPDDDIPF